MLKLGETAVSARLSCESGRLNDADVLLQTSVNWPGRVVLGAPPPHPPQKTRPVLQTCSLQEGRRTLSASQQRLLQELRLLIGFSDGLRAVAASSPLQVSHAPPPPGCFSSRGGSEEGSEEAWIKS